MLTLLPFKRSKDLQETCRWFIFGGNPTALTRCSTLPKSEPDNAVAYL
jgi:hypothetical protein